MGDATTLLFGLDGFRVVSVAQREEHGEGGREVVVEGVQAEQACQVMSADPTGGPVHLIFKRCIRGS